MALPGAVAIERAGLRAWPGIDVEWDGSWVRRASNGLTQRANSAQCFDPEDDGNIPERIAATRAWFSARGLPAIFRVNLLTGPALAAELDRQGWRSQSHSKLMAMELPEVEPDPDGETVSVGDPVFLDTQRRLKGYSEDDLARFRAILDVLEVPARGIVLRTADGRVVSSALMAIADGIVITGNVVTDPAERRKGRAAAMMRTGLAWGRANGARHAALNVEADNAPALALYASLGYRPQYDYVYRYPGDA